MAHFAKIENGIVAEVIVAEQDVIDSGLFGDPASWIQTSYNTQGGVHVLGGTPLRKNFAGIGYAYDQMHDAFIPPKPSPSCILNAETCLWEYPRPYPDDGGKYEWDVETTSWKPNDGKEYTWDDETFTWIEVVA
jgi:hypothetical protein